MTLTIDDAVGVLTKSIFCRSDYEIIQPVCMIVSISAAGIQVHPKLKSQVGHSNSQLHLFAIRNCYSLKVIVLNFVRSNRNGFVEENKTKFKWFGI